MVKVCCNCKHNLKKLSEKVIILPLKTRPYCDKLYGFRNDDINQFEQYCGSYED